MSDTSTRKKPRRGRGEGSIVWLEDKKMWFGRLSVGYDDDGKRVTKAFYSKKNGLKREVIEKMDAYRMRRGAGYKDASSVTLAECMTAWLMTVKRPALKPASYDRLESTVRNHIIPKLGNYTRQEVTSAVIQNKLINPLIGEFSYSTVKKVYDAMNAYFKYAVMNREVMFNPVELVAKPNTAHFKKDRIQTLSDDDIKKFVTAINATDSKGRPVYLYGQAYFLILNTGIRLGEALALKWSDIDFDEKEMTISKNAIITRNRDEDGEADGTSRLTMQDNPKSRSSNRVILLNRGALEALESLAMRRNSDYVISTKAGNYVHPAPFQKTLDRICARAGIDRFGVHVLRHTFATKMIESGANVKVVSKILGHSSVSVTYDTYVHVVEQMERQAMEALDFM